MPNPFSNIFDQQGNATFGNQQVPAQPVQNTAMNLGKPTQQLPEPDPNYAQFMFQKPVNTAERLRQAGVYNPLELAGQYNENTTGRDEQSKRFILGQILGAIGGNVLGAARGVGAQGNLDNTIPALQGTQYMLQHQAEGDQQDAGRYQSALKSYYDAMHGINQENTHIDDKNATNAMGMYKTDAEAKAKAETEAAKLAHEQRLEAIPKRLDANDDAKNHRILTTVENGKIVTHDTGTSRVNVSAMDHEAIQTKKDVAVDKKRIEKNVDQYRKNEAALGKLREGGADAVLTAQLLGKDTSVRTTLSTRAKSVCIRYGF